MIYATGDMHASLDAGRMLYLYNNLTEDDYLIVLGDFGYTWTEDYIKIWNAYKFPFKTIVVLGNHEGYTLLKELPKTAFNGAKCRKLNDNTFIINHGEIFGLEGKVYFVFGGSLSIDRSMRIPYVSWWPDEQPTRNDYLNALENLSRYDFNIDYFLSHDICNDILPLIVHGNIIRSSTCDMLSMLEAKIRLNGGKPYESLFGHHHTFFEFEGERIKYKCLYKQIYNLNTGEIKVF